MFKMLQRLCVAGTRLYYNLKTAQKQPMSFKILRNFTNEWQECKLPA
jgi:hypothetical protein